MTVEQALARKYFELSNASDFASIAELLTENTTYSSANTGVFLGSEQIVSMQREFHASFKKLHWKIVSSTEIQPGIILIDYEFLGTEKNGREVASTGLEYVIVKDGKILHVDIRNK